MNNGITIWLNVDSAVLAERLKRKKYKRPLISHLNDDEIQDYIDAKIKEREPFYAQAQHIYRHPNNPGRLHQNNTC